MGRQDNFISRYTSMYLVVYFDIPVTDREKIKAAREFRSFLLEEGFSMDQYSVYYRFCSNDRERARHSQAVKNALPPEGKVTILTLTTRQFEEAVRYIGRERQENSNASSAESLFF